MKFKSLHSCIYTDNDKVPIEFYKQALNMYVSKRKDFKEDQFLLIYLKSDDSQYGIELTYNHDNRKY